MSCSNIPEHVWKTEYKGTDASEQQLDRCIHCKATRYSEWGTLPQFCPVEAAVYCTGGKSNT